HAQHAEFLIKEFNQESVSHSASNAHQFSSFIPGPNKKPEKLFIARSTSDSYDTAQRANARYEHTQHSDFLMKEF
ncbi:MAG: hypothetical protein ACI4DK_05115, partial [Lachnospiraceae bacterium]